MQEAPSVLLDAPGAAEDAFSLLARWQRFLDVSGRANANTRRQYRRTVVGFLADVMTDPREVTEDQVIDHLALLHDHTAMRGATIRALRSFYSWAEDRGIASNPVRRLRVPKRRYGPAPFLSDEELEAVFRAAERLDPRARPTLELMYATGGRLGSVVALTAEDVKGGLCRFRVAKYDSPYAVPLGERGRGAVAELLALAEYTPSTVRERRPTLVGVGGYSIWRWATLAGEMAGVRCYPHLLRHTFADRISSADPRTWCELMNHRDASLLRRYAPAHDERLRSAVEAL